VVWILLFFKRNEKGENMFNSMKLGILVIVMMVAHSANAVKPVRPPVKVLVNPHNQIVVAEARSAVENERVNFTIKDVLWGNAPDSLTINVKPEAHAVIEKNKTYLIVYSEVMKHPIVRDEKIKNPDGPTIVGYMILNSALFEHNEMIEALFRNFIEGSIKKSEDTLEQLFANLRSNNIFNQQLSVFELYMRKELHSFMSEKQRLELLSIVDQELLNPELSTYALTVTRSFNLEADKKNVAKLARKIIGKYDANVELASFVPGLLNESITLLGMYGMVDDSQRLEPYIFSNSPSVARHAFQSIVLLNPTEAKNIAEKALKKGNTLADTQRVLNQFVNR